MDFKVDIYLPCGSKLTSDKETAKVKIPTRSKVNLEKKAVFVTKVGIPSFLCLQICIGTRATNKFLNAKFINCF